MKVVTLAEAAAHFGVSLSTVKAWCQSGKVDALKKKGYRNKLVWHVVIDARSSTTDHAYTLWHDRWVKHQHAKGHSPRSVEANVEGLKRMWKWLGMTPSIEHLTVQHLELAIDQSGATRAHCKHSQRAHAYNAFRTFTKYLIKYGVKPENALHGIQAIKPKRWTQARRLKLNEVDKQRVYNALKSPYLNQPYQRERLTLAFDMFLYTALRASELTSLTWENISLQKGFEHISIIGKGSKKRHIPLHPHIVDMLKQWKMYGWDRGDTIFNGWNRRAMGKSFRTIYKNAGVTMDVHGLRRTCATNWIEQGVPISVVAQLMGHSDVRQTMEYIGFEDNRAMNFMRDLWNKPDMQPVEQPIMKRRKGTFN